jgi:hypothetical protein
MELRVVRCLYNSESTRGIYIQDGVYRYVTLEDVVRKKGSAKVQDQTAIPAGRYEVIVNMSNRFKREMCLLLNVPGFEGIRIHGGNSAVDTSGCLLVAHNIVDKSHIQGTAETEVTAVVKAAIAAGSKVFIEIVDTSPYYGV